MSKQALATQRRLCEKRHKCKLPSTGTFSTHLPGSFRQIPVCLSPAAHLHSCLVQHRLDCPAPKSPFRAKARAILHLSQSSTGQVVALSHASPGSLVNITAPPGVTAGLSCCVVNTSKAGCSPSTLTQGSASGSAVAKLLGALRVPGCAEA